MCPPPKTIAQLLLATQSQKNRYFLPSGSYDGYDAGIYHRQQLAKHRVLLLKGKSGKNLVFVIIMMRGIRAFAH